MRTLTIATATWREAIRQPVSIIIVAIAAAVTFLSQFLSFNFFDEAEGFNVIRQMAVAQTLMSGIIIAIFTASAVVADEIENRTVVTLLAKPVRRYEIIFGKFIGIIGAIALAFIIMMGISMATAWWTELPCEKWQVNPAYVLADAHVIGTGQSTLQSARSYVDLTTKKDALGTNYLNTDTDLLLLLSGQSTQLAARAVLGDLPGDYGAEPISPGLATLTMSAIQFFDSPRMVLFLQSFALAFMHVVVLAAVAVAVSTRLPLVFTALVCAVFFFAGNILPVLGKALAPGGEGLLGWLAKMNFFLPNFENLSLAEELSVGAQPVAAGELTYSIVYGLLYSAAALAVAFALFRRREVA